MDGLDRAFLNNFAQFGYMNHVVAAIALYNAGASCEETASQLNAHVRQIPIEEARIEAQKWNDASRVQGIVSARLVAEFASAMEDFGALCDAIRYRHRKGLTKRFVMNSVGDVAQYYDHSLLEPEASLEHLLCLPSRDDLKLLLSPDLIEAIVKTYDSYPPRIRQCASWYRSQIPKHVGAEADSDSHSTDAAGMSIMLGMPGELLPVARNPRHPLIQAHNKIKHRFLVIEDIRALQNEAGSLKVIPTVPVKREPAHIATLFNNIIAVSTYTADLAALLIEMHDNGVDL